MGELYGDREAAKVVCKLAIMTGRSQGASIGRLAWIWVVRYRKTNSMTWPLLLRLSCSF
jgi:hypothetical protein